MTDLRINTNPPMTNCLIETRVFDSSHFTFFDVGVSGGIESQWRRFGDQLVAFGFDPWVEECERLSNEENLTKVKYISNLVGVVDNSHWIHGGQKPFKGRDHPIRQSFTEYYERSNMMQARTYLETNADNWSSMQNTARAKTKTFSTDKIQLDRFVKDEKIDSVDFVKIDTDGADFEVLLGCESILESHGMLGFCIESQLHGTFDERSNTFVNINRYLESKGFFLYELSIHRYSRAALPEKCCISITAETLGGQVVWGDAVYLRDPLLSGYSNVWEIDFTTKKLLKLACIYEIYGMPDCAAELIIAYRKQIDKTTDSSFLLDQLTPLLNKEFVGYEKYTDYFRSNTRNFFDEPHKVPYADISDKFDSNEKCEILEQQKDVLIRELALKDTIIEEKKVSIQRLQDLHANLLRAQLE